MNAESSPAYEYAIDSVENAVRTLLMLRDRPAIRAIDVAAELGVARSTAHRMVTTLQHVGMLRRNEADKSYSAGHALVELGMAVIGASDLTADVVPVLERLAAQTGETTHFLVRELDEVVFVAVAEGTHVVRAASRVGTRLPAHVTSAGRCLLAALDSDELETVYPAHRRLRGGTAAALRTHAALTRDLAAVRAAGFAVNRAESEEGLVAVSVCVVDARGAARGAITVSGPAERVGPRADELAAILRSTPLPAGLRVAAAADDA